MLPLLPGSESIHSNKHTTLPLLLLLPLLILLLRKGFPELFARYEGGDTLLR